MIVCNQITQINDCLLFIIFIVRTYLPLINLDHYVKRICESVFCLRLWFAAIADMHQYIENKICYKFPAVSVHSPFFQRILDKKVSDFMISDLFNWFKFLCLTVVSVPNLNHIFYYYQFHWIFNAFIFCTDSCIHSIFSSFIYLLLWFVSPFLSFNEFIIGFEKKFAAVNFLVGFIVLGLKAIVAFY